MHSNLVCDIWGLVLIWFYGYFYFLQHLQNDVILRRHFDVLASVLRYNGGHTHERPWLDEHFGVGFMSLSQPEPKFWPKMWYNLFGDLGLDLWPYVLINWNSSDDPLLIILVRNENVQSKIAWYTAWRKVQQLCGIYKKKRQKETSITS